MGIFKQLFITSVLYILISGSPQATDVEGDPATSDDSFIFFDTNNSVAQTSTMMTSLEIQCQSVWPQDSTPQFETNNPFPTPETPTYTSLPPDLIFGVGDYVVSGRTQIGEQQGPDIRYSTSGTTTRLFIDGDLQLGATAAPGQSPQVRLNFTSQGNPGPSENLIVIVNGNLIVGERVRASGYFFVNGDVNVQATGGGANSFLVGGSITATGNFSQNFGNNTIIDYQPPPPSIETGGFCEAVTSSGPPLLAIDDFESYSPGSIIGSNGGIGAWGSEWRGSAGSQQVIDTSSNPLLYTAPNGEAIVGGARALQLTQNNDRAAFRALDESYGDGVVYVSMLARFDVDRSVQNRFAALWFGRSEFSDVPNVGLKTREGNGGIGANDIFVRTTRNNDRYSTVIERNQTYFIVARLEKSSTASNANYNRMQLWVNPETLSEKPGFATESSGTSDIASFTEVGYRLVNLASNESATIDRLAIGTSWADVVTPQATKHAFYPFDLCFDNAPIIDLAQGNTGTSNNVARASAGQVLAAGEFDGGSSYVDIPAQVLHNLNDFTASVWVHPSSANTYRTILSGSNNDANNTQSLSQFEIYLTDNNFLRVAYKGQYLRFGTNEPQLANNRWSHLAVRKRGAEVCLFVDGSLTSCVSVNDPAALRIEQASIGAWRRAPDSRSDYFSGLIDELIVYSRGLDNTQISSLYARQLDGRNPDGTIRIDTCEEQCFADNFEGGLGDLWVTSRSSGTYTPSVIAGSGSTPSRLRLTEDVGDQATAITLQRIFPSSNNRLVIEFDYYGWSGRSGTGADGVAVILSDASVSARPGSFGGSLGYAQRNNGDPGFAGGWIGIGLDEFGNYSQSNEGRQGGPGFRPNAVAIRGSESSGYRYLAGTPANLSPRIDVRNTSQPGPGHRYRVIVDTTSDGTTVSVERDTGAGFQNLIAPFNAEGFSGQGAPPDEMLLSFTGSTGGSFNHHEIGNVRVCADEWFPVGSQVERFRIRHATSGINCLASEFEVTACADQSCENIYTEQPVSVTMADTQGNFIGGNSFTLNNGQSRFLIQNQQATSISRLQVLSSVPVARPLSTDICQTFGGENTNCEIAFNPSGLVLSSFADSLQNSLENRIAGTPFNSFIHVIDTVENTFACQPRLVDQTLDVELELNCTDPANCGDSQEFLTINGETFVNDGNSYRGILPLTFAGSSAELQSVYSDVGQVSLSARLILPEETSPGSEGPALELQNTAPFTVAPYRLELLARGRDAQENYGSLAGGEAFMAAGEAFELYLASYNEFGSRTSNFGRESRLQATAKFSALVFPAEGVGDSSLFESGSFELYEAGTLRSQSATWLEAGTIEVEPAYQSDSFYSWAPTLTSSLSVGRFYPHSIRPVSGASLGLYHQCINDFSYMDNRDIEVMYTLEAINSQGGRTHNYGRLPQAGGAQYEQNLSIGLSADTLPSGRIIQDVYSDWVAGVLALDYNTEPNGLVGVRRDTQPDGPVTPTLGLVIASQVSNEQTALINPNFSAQEGDSGIELGSIDARFGRLQLNDIFGPEDEDLPILIRAEYWEQSSERFVLNQEDSCTQIGLDDFANNAPSVNSNPVSRGNLTLQQGQPDLLEGPSWSAPGEPVEFTFCLQVPAWLSWSHSEAIAECQPGSPTATATFGQYRGNDRIIFWLERGL